MPTILIRPQCRICGRHAPEAEFVGGPVVGYCLRCYERHAAALAALANAQAFECAECHRTAEQLAGGDNRTKMRLYHKDGTLALLCERCGPVYERSVAQMFRGTPYGAAQNL